MKNPKSIKNLKPFKPGFDERRNLDGKPEGIRNRSTVGRFVLDMAAKYPDNIFIKLKEQYPNLEKEMDIEQMMAVVMADRAIRKQDPQAYEKLMDSVYGKAGQKVDLNTEGEVTIRIIRNPNI